MPAQYAASFSGSNYLVRANYTGNPAAFSVSCWVKLSGSQASRIFFSDFLNDGSNRGWAVGISDTTNNQIKFYLGSNTLGQSGTLANATWIHCVFTWDGTTAKIYLNGNTTPNATLTSGVNYGPVPGNNYIGTLDGSRQFLSGQLAAVGYWSRALSTSEVSALYNGGSGLAYGDLTGSLLTSLGSYHDFANVGNLGLDSTAAAANFTNTGAVTQQLGPGYQYFPISGARPVATPQVRTRHPLFKGRGGVAWPARDWPQFTGGIATAATRWGTVPFLGTNFTGGGYTPASQVTLPGRGYVTAPDQVTLFYVGASTTNQFGQSSSNPIATSGSFFGGYVLGYGTAGTTYAPYLAIANSGSTYHNVTCGWTLTTGHTYAIAIARDRSTGVVNFYSFDYDLGVLATGTTTDTTAAVAGDGAAAVNLTTNTANSYTGSLVTAGFTAGVWTLADFLAWVADPLGPVRPVHATSPGVILAAVAAGSLRFRRIGMDGGMPSYLYTGGFG